MSGISVQLPLEISDIDGAYTLNKTYAEAIKQNFRHMILTNPGEKLTDPEFGAGVIRLLFENYIQGVTDSELNSRIIEQKERYMPFILIENLQSEFEEGKLYLKIEYSVPKINLRDVLAINID